MIRMLFSGSASRSEQDGHHAQSGESGSLGEVLGNGRGNEGDDQYEGPLYIHFGMFRLGLFG